jgi:hypothetical protein
MEFVFDKKFVLNWTPNPARPGAADAIVFILKYSILGGGFVTIFAVVGYPVAALILWASAVEEQAMVTWMKNAVDPFRAAVILRMTLIGSEFIFFGLPVGAFGSVSNVVSHFQERAIPTAVHLSLLCLGYVLMQRRLSWTKIWFSCAAGHLFYNSAVEIFS